MREHISRVMWRLYEPIHSVVYFQRDATERYREIGLKGGWMSYFASRSAALGTPSPEVVEAVFYHFAPSLVRRAIPSAWQLANPELILQIRHDIAYDAISRGIDTALDTASLMQLAEEILDVAATLPISGRTLYAAHLGIDWGRSSALRLFGASTLLREHRGDTHNSALAAHGIDGIQSHLLQVAAGAVTHEVIFPTRGWSPDAWNDGFERLASNGLLSARSTPEEPILTELGHNIKQRIESQTDEQSNPWSDLDDRRLQRLEEGLRIASAHVKQYVGFPAANPIGV